MILLKSRRDQGEFIACSTMSTEDIQAKYRLPPGTEVIAGQRPAPRLLTPMGEMGCSCSTRPSPQAEAQPNQKTVAERPCKSTLVGIDFGHAL